MAAKRRKKGAQDANEETQQVMMVNGGNGERAFRYLRCLLFSSWGLGATGGLSASVCGTGSDRVCRHAPRSWPMTDAPRTYLTWECFGGTMVPAVSPGVRSPFATMPWAAGWVQPTARRLGLEFSLRNPGQWRQQGRKQRCPVWTCEFSLDRARLLYSGIRRVEQMWATTRSQTMTA